jgi:hypothetical protein
MLNLWPPPVGDPTGKCRTVIIDSKTGTAIGSIGWK